MRVLRNTVNVRFNQFFVTSLMAENYEQLSRELALCATQDIADFFVAEGYMILMLAITASKITPLVFLFDHIPLDALQEVLAQDLEQILKNFLYTQRRREELGANSVVWRNLLIEKFKIFLKIAPYEIQEFMESYLDVSYYVTLSMKVDYQTALVQFRQEHRSSLML